MSRSVQDIQADIDRVRARQVSGVSRVATGDRSIQYDTTQDAATLVRLEAELAAAQGSGPVTRMSFVRVGMRRY